MKRYYTIMITVIVLLLLPIAIWYLQPSPDISVAVIDKTVRQNDYREHAGVSWVLNYLKITDLDGKPYDKTRDYFGITYDETTEEYTEMPLPTDYSDYDAVYLADTYGVYKDPTDNVHSDQFGARSEKIYGGLTLAEWQSMSKRFADDKPSLLVAEYNTFASPTDATVRDSMLRYLGISWNGWVARYFNSLDPNVDSDVANWLEENSITDWDHDGPGMLFVNDITQDYVVLDEGEDFSSEGIILNYTEEGQDFFGMKKSTRYDYWFDVIEANPDTTVLANYDIGLTDAAKEILVNHEIALQPAAVTQLVTDHHQSYYFAGDYNDTTSVSPYYQYKGMAKIQEWVAKVTDGDFYWSTYAPMMGQIMKGFEDMKANPVTSEPEKDTVASAPYQFKVAGDRFEVLQEDGSWKAITIKGVNIGMADGGHFPGEAALTYSEYARWFEQIGEMNANTIRVYTIHPPAFYQALLDYNNNHKDAPIYLFHGVWMNEEMSVEAQNVYDEATLSDFREQMTSTVDVIHGNKLIEAVPGHAYGLYDADISQYVIGFMIGTEWDPDVIQGTNEKNADLGDYSGQYFETKDASPIEHFLAENMDYTMAYEIDNYGVHRPMSFTNWVTTDLLSHPTESSEKEDMVSVNPNLIHTKNEANETGQFASYHVYPYYPDFLNYTKKYNEYKDFRGNNNPYAAYLNELRNAHDMPVLIAEFGLPTSRGITHENVIGRDQGGNTEEEQGQMVSDMYEEILNEGMMGGIVFSWQDEWFKRTWNTMDYDNPDRRPFWSNAQTSEQQFGILSFDRLKIKVNGDTSDWDASEEKVQLVDAPDEALKAVWADYDERYLYLRIDYDTAAKGYPIVTFDTVPGQGNDKINSLNGLKLTEQAEFVLNLNPDESRITVDKYYDFFTKQYAIDSDFLLGKKIAAPDKNTGDFSPIQLALNKRYYNVDEDKTEPFKAYETGKLVEGNGDPTSADYNSLADYYVNEEAGIIEVRLPWLLLSAKDPSRKEFQGDIMADGLGASINIDNMTIGAAYLDDNDKVLYQAPSKAYTWDNWEVPLTAERLKESYSIIQETFAKYE
ncbi:hypothetical protein EF384_03445 [Aerococcus agrisoli]|uniref:Family 2 glycosyl transferase n=1 Tax=Aerococcus agrisoli TaxID=2487350 RepID=A0A3N4GGF4_9LACT|nr:hypothetical protein [Aerococcus agrisoli]RPA60918.1 hypothetical protein EF384_03445 [Aerococcus agrisoli]